MTKKHGFTLIELLVAVGLLGLLAVATSNLLFDILRSTSKSRVLSEVKQNGDYAVGVMERLIKNSGHLEVVGIGNCGTMLRVRDLEGNDTLFTCGGDPSYLASNSARLINDQVKVENCSAVFCLQGSQPAKVTIDFTLSQSNDDLIRPEDKAEISFHTTVIQRNY